MKTYLTTTAVALALATSHASANSDQTDIEQILDGIQSALNGITADAGGSDISQSATNAGNLIARGDESLDDVSQEVFRMRQIARNWLTALDGGGGFEDVVQEATNVLNSISVDPGDSDEIATLAVSAVSIEEIDQRALGNRFGPDQVATNRIFFDEDSLDFDQSAVNAVNLVSAAGVDITQPGVVGPWWRPRFEDGVEQTILSFRQVARNTVVGDDANDNLVDVVQSATNVGNSVEAGNVTDDIKQIVYWTSQSAGNRINVPADIRDFSQSATNVLNSISVDEIDDILQRVGLSRQSARNVIITDDDLEVPRIKRDGIKLNTQDAVNAANIATFSTADWVKQSAYATDQSAVNIIWGLGRNIPSYSHNDDIDDVAQTATNVVNSVNAEEGTADRLYQYVNEVDQFARNFIDYGRNVDDVTQEATNAANIAQFGSIDYHTEQVYHDNRGGYAQQAINRVSRGDRDGSISDLVQSATNVINSLSGDALPADYRWYDVDVYQLADLYDDNNDQLATNFVRFGTGGLEDLEQSATNVANSISVASLGGRTVQVGVHVDQEAYNTALGRGSVSGNVDVNQAATNATNLISAGSLPDLAGVTDILQESITSQQYAMNELVSFGSVTDFTQSAVNVANSISVPATP